MIKSDQDSKLFFCGLDALVSILSLWTQEAIKQAWSFHHYLKSTIPQLINKKKSGQVMNQQLINTTYSIPHPNSVPGSNNYSKFCDFSQNYLQNFAFFPQHQLISYYPSWPIAQFCQPFIPRINDLTLTQSPVLTQPDPISQPRPDSLHHHRTNDTYEVEVIEDDIPIQQIEEQKKIQRRLNRIKHITEVNKNRVLKKGKKNFTSYYWNADENKRYLEFLRLHPGIFELSVSEKKNMRVNVMMSKKVKTRTPQQCHSHHQKMMKKYGSIENILSQMENEGSHNSEDIKLERDQVKDQVKLEDQKVDM